jgi:L-asparaginase
MEDIKELLQNNVIVYNVTQCREGHVEMGKYESSSELAALGVISGADVTIETAIAKGMFVLAATTDVEQRKQLLQISLRGEITT